jgi:hypothetical protein
MTNFNLSFPIDIIKKEQRIILGIATADNIDKVGDVVDFEASLSAFKNWQGNIREMHAPIAVGKAISYKPIKINDPDGKEYNAIQVEAYISKGAESTWQKILDGTLRAFSIGGKIIRKEMMQNKIHNGRQVHIIKEYDLGELSLVDNPANAVAVIDLIKKADDGVLDYVLTIDEDIEKKQPLKDPKGGLTAAGRRHFKQTEGANLKPGVRGAADTPEKMRRKGSFLTRFFTNPSGPMKKPNGKPTRLALSAAAWGEPVPQDRSDAARLAAKGRRLLERYRNTKERAQKSIEIEHLDVKDDLINALFEEIESIQLEDDGYTETHLLDFMLDDIYEELIEMENIDLGSVDLLQEEEKYDTMKPMDNSIDKESDKLSLIKKFISWLTDQPGDNSLDESEQAEASVEAEVKNDQMEEEMDIEILKEALGSVIDQKLNDFATSLKAEVEANVSAKIDEVAKSFDAQKQEISQKLEATEKALEEQTAKVEEFAQAGAMKKSVDSEEDEQVEELKKSEPEKSFWSNVYLPQGVINSLGYKS